MLERSLTPIIFKKVFMYMEYDLELQQQTIQEING